MEGLKQREGRRTVPDAHSEPKDNETESEDRAEDAGAVVDETFGEVRSCALLVREGIDAAG